MPSLALGRLLRVNVMPPVKFVGASLLIEPRTQ